MIKGEAVSQFESADQSTGLSNANLSDEPQKVFFVHIVDRKQQIKEEMLPWPGSLQCCFHDSRARPSLELIYLKTFIISKS